jgi:hypothetical protein
MSYVAFALSLYFAATLGFAGAAKIDGMASFTTTLRKQHVLPEPLIALTARALPSFEVALAVLLTVGVLTIPVALILFVTFSAFLVFKVALYLHHATVDCGCFGASGMKSSLAADMTVSGIQWLLAGVYLWLSLHVPPVAPPWRLASTLLLVFLVLQITRTILKRRQARYSRLREPTA